MRTFVAAALLLFLAVGCSGDGSSSSDESPAPNPPAWLMLEAGQKVMLTGSGPEPSVSTTTVACDDSYEYDRYSTGGGGEEGCRDHAIGQTVIIKRVDSGDSALYVRGRGWSGVVSDQDVQPIIPSGITMDCQSTDSLALYASPSDTAADYDLRDQKVTIETIHSRRSNETWALNVRVVKGHGARRVGYFRSEDLAACVLPGQIQVVMHDKD